MPQLVDEWHLHNHAHALLAPFRGLVLQAGCFHFDATTGNTQKLKYHVIPSRELVLPVFHEGVAVTHVVYRLNSFVLRLSETPASGHYQAIMLDHDDIHLLDDNVPSRACGLDEFEDGCLNSYLFFYNRAEF